jgi:hypothetical protein
VKPAKITRGRYRSRRGRHPKRTGPFVMPVNPMRPFLPSPLLAAGLALLLGLAAPAPVVLDDFERDAPGAWPGRWAYIGQDGRSYPPDHAVGGDERFTVVSEGGNRFLRLYTRDGVHRITLATNRTGGVRWDLGATPHLTWRWRARRLPPGARETVTRLNDTGAALYVTFGRDLIGRPRSIKYTYSSTLPVGSTLRDGALRVVVVSSGRDGTGTWQRVARDVAADYAALFGGTAPDPISVTLWSDTDNTHAEAEVDVDDVVLR